MLLSEKQAAPGQIPQGPTPRPRCNFRNRSILPTPLSHTLLSNFRHCPNVEISPLPPSDSPDPHQTPIMLLLSYPAIAILYLLLHLPSTNGAPNCAVCWPVGHSQDPVVGFDFTLGYGYALTVTDDALLWVMTKASQNVGCPIPERRLR